MSAKAGKSKPVVLKLSPAALRTFPHEPASTPAESKSISLPDAPSVPQIIESAFDTPADADADSASAMNGTSTPSSLAPPAAATKKKGPAPKKRKEPPTDGANGVNNSASGAGTPKPRGKPGPKKKQKLGDMINDPNSKSPFAAPAPIAKLGPKANQGAINANLRSLDRTGKFKVRKWVKKGLALRSFTGVVWTVPSYTAPQHSSPFSEDVKSDTTGSSDTKLKDESSAISEKSGMNGVGSSAPTPMDDTASSPAPIAAGS